MGKFIFKDGDFIVANIASRLTLYAGVPLDNTYENTFTSNTLISQSASSSVGVYNTNKPAYYINFANNSVRVDCVNMKVNNFNLYSCNYMSFINPTYEDKIFYCFVTEVKYINDKTAELKFEVDVMQTWLISGRCSFENCLIERKHTDDDIIGKYILDEPVDVGDYVYTLGTRVNPNLKMCIGIAGIYDDGEWKESGAVTYEINGYKIIDGVSRFVFNPDGTTYDYFGDNPFADCSQLIRILLSNGGKLDWIKYAYYFPMMNGTAIISRNAYNGIGENNSYVPKNNKLWCYPYYGASVNNHEGSMSDYAFELSTDNDVLTFNKDYSLIDGSGSLMVTNYKHGELNSVDIKTKFPVLSCASQEYATYMANLKAQMPTDIATNVAMPAVSGALFGSQFAGIGGVAGALIGGVGGLISYALKAYGGAQQAKLKGATPTGSNSGMLQIANNTLGFDIYFKSIREEYAKSIDAFFTKFGYKVNVLEKPKTTNGRGLNWHYTKTIGCAIKGSAPSSDISKIVQIMDNGITFWKIKDVGNYTFS